MMSRTQEEIQRGLLEIIGTAESLDEVDQRLPFGVLYGMYKSRLELPLLTLLSIFDQQGVKDELWQLAAQDDSLLNFHVASMTTGTSLSMWMHTINKHTREVLLSKGLLARAEKIMPNAYSNLAPYFSACSMLFCLAHPPDKVYEANILELQLGSLLLEAKPALLRFLHVYPSTK